MKRILLPALVVSAFYIWVLRRSHAKEKLIMLTGAAWEDQVQERAPEAQPRKAQFHEHLEDIVMQRVGHINEADLIKAGDHGVHRLEPQPDEGGRELIIGFGQAPDVIAAHHVDAHRVQDAGDGTGVHQIQIHPEQRIKLAAI